MSIFNIINIFNISELKNELTSKSKLESRLKDTLEELILIETNNQ